MDIKYSDLNNTEIRNIDFENCPSKCVSCKEDWDMYDEFKNAEELDDEIIDNCSTETMDEISYDALYNYDTLWMTAIQKAFPNKVTDTQCGWGMIEMK